MGLQAPDFMLVNRSTGEGFAVQGFNYDIASKTATVGFDFAALPDGDYRLTIVAAGTGGSPFAEPIDGEWRGSLPSGDGVSGGDFSVDFQVGVASVAPVVTNAVPGGGAPVAPPQVILLTFSENILA